MQLTAYNLIELAVILMLLGASLALGFAASATRRSPRIDRRALTALDETGAYLRNLAGFDVSIETEVEQTTGAKLRRLDIHSCYKIKWPDLMYAELSAEGRTLKFYFYGGEFTVFSPNLDKYSKIKLPPLLRQALDFIYWRSGFRVPLARLIYFDSKTQGHRELASARRIGSDKLDGLECEIFAFRQGGLEQRVWIRHAPAPLPVRLETRDPQWHHGSRHISRLDWKAYAR